MPLTDSPVLHITSERDRAQLILWIQLGLVIESTWGRWASVRHAQWGLIVNSAWVDYIRHYNQQPIQDDGRVFRLRKP